MLQIILILVYTWNILNNLKPESLHAYSKVRININQIWQHIADRNLSSAEYECVMRRIHKHELVRHDLILMLNETIKSFNNLNINYSIASGTMLGAVRQNGLLLWDYDIDLIIMDHDLDIPAIQSMIKYNISRFEDTGPQYRITFGQPYDDLHIDLYHDTNETRDDDHWVLQNFRKVEHRDLILVLFNNVLVSMITDYKENIITNYGLDWDKPRIYCYDRWLSL